MQKISLILIIALCGFVIMLQLQTHKRLDTLEKFVLGLNSKLLKQTQKFKKGEQDSSVFQAFQANTKVQIPIGSSYTQGSKQASLTLVEFTDIECIYCAQVSPVLEKLAKEFPNRLRIVFKHFPLSFHKKARSAHIALLAAGEQNRFFEYRYKLAKYSRELSSERYFKIAQELGLDIEEFKKTILNVQDKLETINNDILLGRKIGVQGTPTLFANGEKVVNRSYNALKQLILNSSNE